MGIYTITYWGWYTYSNGIKVENVTKDVAPSEDDWLIVFQPYRYSPEKRELLYEVLERFHISKRVLVHYEGRYLQPHGFRLRYQQLYGRIYTYVSTDVDGDTVKYMPAPVWIAEENFVFKENKSKFFCTVVTNYGKNGEPRGVIVNKLKSLGMKVYGKTSNTVPDDNPTPDGMWRGRYVAKVNLMSDYIFGLAIENQLDLGHVTEKPFDIMAAGCIPIYLGPKDASTFIPKDCYIDYRDFWSEIDLMKYIKSLSKTDISNYQKNILRVRNSLIGMRTYESCMRFLCKDLGFDCDSHYHKQLLLLSKILAQRTAR